MTKGGRDARSVSFAALEREGSSVDPSRFVTSGRWSGWWHAEDAATPLPEPVVVADESRSVVDAAIAALPPNQRLVVTLRDVRGFTAVETTRLLGVTEANERVLLHRARTRVRAAVETYAHERAGTEP
jgi:RNA polymerase sigma-70 factor (ECF subfamily)